MTRNDAYKAARHAWRFWFRRGQRDYQSATENTVKALRAQGCTSAEIQMVKLWLKALRAGRRWPAESDMRRIEADQD